jgi:hypothetical protein
MATHMAENRILQFRPPLTAKRFSGSGRAPAPAVPVRLAPLRQKYLDRINKTYRIIQTEKMFCLPCLIP